MKVERLEVLKVTLEDDFYVLVVPNDFPGEEGYRDFYVAHEFCGHVMYAVGCCVKSDEEVLDIVDRNADDWIRLYGEDMER